MPTIQAQNLRPPSGPPKILFICRESSVYGPLAEALACVLYGACTQASSAGIAKTALHPELQDILKESQIHVDGLSSRDLKEVDCSTFDSIILLESLSPIPADFNEKNILDWSNELPAQLDNKSSKTDLRKARESLRGLLVSFGKQLTYFASASYLNWRAHQSGWPSGAWHEVPFYSDSSYLRGGSLDEDLGPYKLHLGFHKDSRDPALLLTVKSHYFGETLHLSKNTNITGFTGSTLGDEIAVLCSLEMGIRLSAGDSTRSSTRDGWALSGDNNRPIFFPKRSGYPSILPRVFSRNTLCVDLLALFPRIVPHSATALVRAARAYRDAIWVAETQPELSWLLFVAALETAAVDYQADSYSPLEVLKQSKPELVQDLERVGVDEVVATAFRGELRATARFLAFVVDHIPSPPTERPPEFCQVDWSKKGIRRLSQKVYELRSKALHEGIPFPPPMNFPPEAYAREWTAPAETVRSAGTYTMGGFWKGDDVPMSLHTFEYLTRGCLLNWWRSLAKQQDAATPSKEA